MTENIVIAIKGSVAGGGTLLLIWDYWLRRGGKQRQFRRLRDCLLASFGLIAFFAWWNFGYFNFGQYVHIWEHYHYYVGAKYHRELGYSRLYVCTAVAEIEQGFGEQVAERTLRNLETNTLESSASIVADPVLCQRYFTPARWEAFKRDIAYFHSRVDTANWNRMQKDHGYNGTPVWGIAGGVLANLMPASDTYILCLALLDPLLLAVMWGFVLWAFGWRAMCVALLYWGCNFPARFSWNGGAYLRMDWLATAIIGICLLKREHFASGGFALTYSALLRIFPVFIVFGIIAKAVARWGGGKRELLPAHVMFAKGAFLAIAIFFPLSCTLGSGIESWTGFAINSTKHLQTPLTNNMGLKTLVAFQPSTRAERLRDARLDEPYEVWTRTRRMVFAQRRAVYMLFVAVFLLLLGYAVRNEPDWVAAALGVGTIVVAAELTCYYYSVLLAMALLYARREPAGIIAVAMAALTCLCNVGIYHDLQYVAASAIYVGGVYATVAYMAYCVWTDGCSA